MFLRYSLIFLYEEQSWMKLLSLLEHKNNNDLLARRVKSDDDIDHHESFKIDESKSDNVDENDDENSDAFCERDDFKRVTQKEFYRYLSRIRHARQAICIILIDDARYKRQTSDLYITRLANCFCLSNIWLFAQRRSISSCLSNMYVWLTYI